MALCTKFAYNFMKFAAMRCCGQNWWLIFRCELYKKMLFNMVYSNDKSYYALTCKKITLAFCKVLCRIDSRAIQLFVQKLFVRLYNMLYKNLIIFMRYIQQKYHLVLFDIANKING